MRDAMNLRTGHEEEGTAEGTLDSEGRTSSTWNGIFGERDGAGYKRQGLVGLSGRKQGHIVQPSGRARVYNQNDKVRLAAMPINDNGRE